ncbi:MAG TPA: hypothetical protein VE961_24825 [Pyrinomonadaceae bacterium]|nr:hypothetical protein [Pyrinomonadaceae bacterium]
MESIVGIFNSFADAKRASAILRSLGIPDNRVAVLAPNTRESEIEAGIPTTDTEQPGVGAALGGMVGAALGVAGGLEAGAVAASLLVPGVGPVLALGILGAAILGVAGGATGAMAGQALEEGLAPGIPRDELFVYEDALRRGRSIVVAFVDDADMAAKARTELSRAGAESIDAARDEWWVGLRDAEREHYTQQGGSFDTDEAKYRLGFEAAMRPDCRGKSCADMQKKLNQRYGAEADAQPFREGYNRGQHYLICVVESHRDRNQNQEGASQSQSKRAA